MKPGGALLAATVVVLTGGALAGEVAMTGVANPARARVNYILQCQGCHRADASGDEASTPAMAGIIGEFLGVEGGRQYLVQVPGVANAVLSDRDLAELLNWTLYSFDAAHMPADFKPYTAEEIKELRKKPLRTGTKDVRAALVAKMTTTNKKGEKLG